MDDMMGMLGATQASPMLPPTEATETEQYRINPIRKNCVQEKDEMGEWVDKECYNTPGQAQAELSKLLGGETEEPFDAGGFGA